MAKALVVYESMFGNTARIAQAIVAGLATRIAAEAVEVNAAPAALPDDVTLLVVGGPTHAFGMTRATTRQSAHRQANEAHRDIGAKALGLREWLGELEQLRRGMPAAAFDTRVRKPRVPGSAARAAARRLRRLGAHLAVPAASFWVAGGMGPLVEGEERRARGWGERIAALVAGSEAPTPVG